MTEKLLAKAHAQGVKDAKSALDSGDYGYHQKTKGLSVVTLRSDMWSFRVDAFTKLAREPKLLAKCEAAWKLGWKEGIAGPAKPTFETVLENLRKTGALDFRDLPDAREVPKEFERLRTVKNVSVRMRKLAKLERLFTMPNVERAYLGKLGWKSVPHEISAWKKVTVLSLSENRLTDIDAVCSLTTLRELSMGAHRLAKLPDDIGNLVNLESLDLFQAKATFTELPPSFAQLKKLRTVRMPLNADALKQQARKLLPRVKVS